jgi:hypothetical protein
MREFETKKRTVSPKSDGMVTMRSAASFSSHFKTKKKKDFQQYVSEPEYVDRVFFKRDKIPISAELFKQFFTDSISNTMCHVREILGENDYRGIETILLVGDSLNQKLFKMR